MIGFRRVRKAKFRTVKSGLVSARLRNHFIRPKPMGLGQLKRHCHARIDYALCAGDRHAWRNEKILRLVVAQSTTKAALRKRLQLEAPALFPDSAFVGF